MSMEKNTNQEYDKCPDCMSEDIQTYDYTVYGEGSSSEIEEKRICDICGFTWTSFYTAKFSHNEFD